MTSFVNAGDTADATVDADEGFWHLSDDDIIPSATMAVAMRSVGPCRVSATS